MTQGGWIPEADLVGDPVHRPVGGLEQLFGAQHSLAPASDAASHLRPELLAVRVQGRIEPGRGSSACDDRVGVDVKDLGEDVGPMGTQKGRPPEGDRPFLVLLCVLDAYSWPPVSFSRRAWSASSEASEPPSAAAASSGATSSSEE